MTDSSNEYRTAFDAAKRELAELLQIQEALEKRLVVVRQTVQGLKELCESEAIKIPISKEAEYLLDNSSLPDEIENILKARYPDELRAIDIRQQLEKLGHDMDQYANPLATIHMVLKRLVESGRIRERQHPQGFRVHQAIPHIFPPVDEPLDFEKIPERIRQFMEPPTKFAERTRQRKSFGQRFADRADKK
jgi:hypothetical protein